MSELFQTYEKLPRIPQKLIPRLHKLCGKRYIDLLLHMPAGCLHRKYVETLDEAGNGDLITIKVQVVTQHKPHNRKQPFRVFVADKNNEQLELLFFNHGAWLAQAYAVGKSLYVTGNLERTLSGVQMVHPDNFTANKSIDEVSGSFPIYPLTAGITQNTIQRAIHLAFLMAKHEEQPDWIPEDTLREKGWPEFTKALDSIHNPTSADCANTLSPAYQRLAFDELYAWQYALKTAREETKSHDGIAHQLSGEMRDQFLNNLPFPLTGDQTKAVEEIDVDMGDSAPMLRLVQGDVGSGKTVVAFMALIRAIENGHQGAMMAPTEVLAVQHFENAKKWLEPLGIKVGLLTGKLKAKEKRETKKLIESGELNLVIGTHALIQDDVIFKNISLCVIDEQHRFGVKQRLALTDHDNAPDLLVMTATPIPRTLALTAYGDMDITIIAEKPPGRTPIDTRVFPLERLREIAMGLGRVMEKGEQVYWICPLVEESEKSDLAAVTERHKVLEHLYGDQVALLHGKMKGQAKEDILADFKAGKTKILVSTTAVEVGVDVPQATCIIIEHAERFGLSQLHQLRGRVGRGSLQSNCMLLYTSPLGQFSKKRLDALKNSNDGFYLAEKDLELRGPGEVLGTAQAGHFITKVANMLEHRHLIPMARDLARSDYKPRNLAFLLHTFQKENAKELMAAG